MQVVDVDFGTTNVLSPHGIPTSPTCRLNRT